MSSHVPISQLQCQQRSNACQFCFTYFPQDFFSEMFESKFQFPRKYFGMHLLQTRT